MFFKKSILPLESLRIVWGSFLVLNGRKRSDSVFSFVVKVLVLGSSFDQAALEILLSNTRRTPTVLSSITDDDPLSVLCVVLAIHQPSNLLGCYLHLKG